MFTQFFSPVFIISILVALSVHEWAHGFVANLLGDPTAEMHGRLTLNPLAHLDPLGTLLFVFVGFGWGKPVPVNPAYFRHPKRDTALVSLAGPGSNFLLAFLAFAGLLFVTHAAPSNIWDALPGSPSTAPVTLLFLQSLFSSLLFVNLGLMAFNLLPIAPLDGSKILQAFIPLQYEEQYETFMRWGPYVLLGLLVAENILGVPLLIGWLSFIMDGVLNLFHVLLGWLA